MNATIRQYFSRLKPQNAVHYCEELAVNQWLRTRWRLSQQRYRSQQRLRTFANIHKGKRCFIIGNGPSLNQTDLTVLKNEITFGMNRIYLMFPKLQFTTTYLVAVNSLVLEQCREEITKLPMPKFLSWRVLGHYPIQQNTILLRTSGDVGFSDQPDKMLYESGTVTQVALQLAYYMGFSEAILIGVDHNFKTKGPANQAVVSQGPDPNHFSPSYFPKGFRWHLPNLEGSEAGYLLAKQAFENDRRRVIDATVGGNLQVFPKVTYEDLF